MRPRSSCWCVLVAVVLVWPPLATAKSRNRVQKWQQRTWRSRFGERPNSLDWKFDRKAGLSQDELDLLDDRHVPNGYSNFHYRFNDLPRSHRRKAKHGGRIKRFVVESDEAPVQFQDDLLENAPFVFGDNYQQGLGNDIVDLDFVRDEDDETGDADIDFMPMQPPAGQTQKLVTVDEVDPFPHSSPKNGDNNKRNATQKVQYTLIIHHGQNQPGQQQLGDYGAPGLGGRALGTPLLVLVMAVICAASTPDWPW